MKNFKIENTQVNIDPVPEIPDVTTDARNFKKGLLTKIITFIVVLILTGCCLVCCYNKTTQRPPTKPPTTTVETLYSTPRFKGVEYTAALKTAIATGTVSIEDYSLITTVSSTESSASIIGDGRVYVAEIKYLEYSKEDAEKLFDKPKEHKGYWSYVIDYNA